jgi:hypothetical protein
VLIASGAGAATAAHKLRKDAPPTAYGSACWSADDRSLLVACDYDGEFRQLCRLDIATDAMTAITAAIPWCAAVCVFYSAVMLMRSISEGMWRV